MWVVSDVVMMGVVVEVRSAAVVLGKEVRMP
jgi:hypothetical protein